MKRVLVLFALLAFLGCAILLCSCSRSSNTIVIGVSKEDTDSIVSVKDATSADFSADLIKRANRMPAATYDKLPGWSGVTLENKADYDWDIEGTTGLSIDFDETDVELVSEMGFDFVRIPLDYRFIFASESSTDEVYLSQLQDIDELIQTCITNGIHVCLSLENVPGGYQADGEARTLFTKVDEQQRMIAFWSLLAQRYAELPSNALSFNLYSKPPASVTDGTYSSVMTKVIEAVRAASPERLIFVDMLGSGTTPVSGLASAKVAQAFRFYEPQAFTAANVTDAFEDDSQPAYMSWPTPYLNGYVSASGGPYTINGDFKEGTTVEVTVGRVCGAGKLTLLADGKEQGSISFATPTAGKEGCSQLVTDATFGDYGVYDQAYTITLSSDAEKIELYDNGCTWLYLSSVRILGSGDSVSLLSEPMDASAKKLTNTILTIKDDGIVNDGALASKAYDAQTMRDTLKTCLDFSTKSGEAVMMLGFGFHYRTTYDEGIDWLVDLLDQVDTNKLAWCHAGFFGPYGFVMTDTKAYERYDADYAKLSKTRSAASAIQDILKEYR